MTKEKKLMNTPQPIKPGSKIRIVSPAGKIKEEHVMPAVEWLRGQGYKVEIGKHVFSEHFQFAGTDKHRRKDLQEALDDTNCDAIICSRGGYGAVRILDRLKFSTFLEKPKWLVGFSDITALHSCLNNLNVASIHGVMPRYFFNEDGSESESLLTMMKLITGEEISYEIETSEMSRTGKAKGELVGGNLALITSLQGSNYDLDTDGKILFIEDIGEYLYRIDRMMHQLKLGGKLDNLEALIVGDFSDTLDNDSPFGQKVEEIIWKAVKEYDYPVCFGFPAGHEHKNLALTFGKKWKLNIKKDKTNLSTKS